MSSEMGHCSVCGKDACVEYPLLAGTPKFCSEHHNPKDAGPFGCDFSGPDDFDIPFDDSDVPFCDERYPLAPEFSTSTFVWTDRWGRHHKLRDIDDAYLTNIISYLGRRIPELEKRSAVHWTSVRTFLTGEAKRRGVEVFCG